jgi:hypothetical protein
VQLGSGGDGQPVPRSAISFMGKSAFMVRGRFAQVVTRGRGPRTPEPGYDDRLFAEVPESGVPGSTHDPHPL